MLRKLAVVTKMVFRICISNGRNKANTNQLLIFWSRL